MPSFIIAAALAHLSGLAWPRVLVEQHEYEQVPPSPPPRCSRKLYIHSMGYRKYMLLVHFMSTYLDRQVLPCYIDHGDPILRRIYFGFWPSAINPTKIGIVSDRLQFRYTPRYNSPLPGTSTSCRAVGFWFIRAFEHPRLANSSRDLCCIGSTDQ
jgi:hypothetical protein